MSKTDKRQRQKARRAAAEASRRKAALRKRRIRAGIVFALATAASVALLASMWVFRTSSSPEAATPTPVSTQITPGPGISCPEAAAPNPREYPGRPPILINPQLEYQATMTTNFGPIKIELFPENSPLTVNNFVTLACDGFYNGSKFHRIADDPPVIQGGDARSGDGTGGPGYRFDDELGLAKELGYKRSLVAMANAGPNTNGSQFFIVVRDTTLPPNFSVFGIVSEGMDVVDQIHSIERIPGTERPAKDAIIETITVTESPAER